MTTTSSTEAITTQQTGHPSTISSTDSTTTTVNNAPISSHNTTTIQPTIPSVFRSARMISQRAHLWSSQATTTIAVPITTDPTTTTQQTGNRHAISSLLSSTTTTVNNAPFLPQNITTIQSAIFSGSRSARVVSPNAQLWPSHATTSEQSTPQQTELAIATISNTTTSTFKTASMRLQNTTTLQPTITDVHQSARVVSQIAHPWLIQAKTTTTAPRFQQNTTIVLLHHTSHNDTTFSPPSSSPPMKTYQELSSKAWRAIIRSYTLVDRLDKNYHNLTAPLQAYMQASPLTKMINNNDSYL